MKWHKEMIIYIILVMTIVCLCLSVFLPKIYSRTSDFWLALESVVFLSYIATDIKKLKNIVKIVFAFFSTLAIVNLFSAIKISCLKMTYWNKSASELDVIIETFSTNYIIDYIFCVCIFALVVVSLIGLKKSQ